MPLTPLPGEGIELPLSEYTRLRAFQGGGWFWDHENQQVIRAELGDFLPRVEERARGTTGGAVARFQHFVGGAEVAGKSDAVGASMNRVPRAEYHRLQHALEALKRKAEDPHTDPTARRIIEKFSLPDPTQNPDLYRLHGSTWNRRLLVLWGCEKEQGTSLAPVAALQKLSVEPPAASFLRRLPLLLGLLLLLLLLAFLAYHFWPRHDERTPVNGGNFITTDSPAPSPSPLATASPGTSLAPAVGGANTPAASGRTGDAIALPPVRGTSPVPAVPLPGRHAQEASDDLAATAKGAGQPPPSLSPNLAGSVPPSGSPGETGPPADPSPALDDATTTNRRSTSTTSRSTRSVSPARAEPSLPPPNDPSASASAPPSSSPASALPPESFSKPSTLSPPRPPRLEIINAPSSAPPHDGKLDLTLVAAAHEADGALATVEVTRWEVDGQRQQDRTGHDTTGTQLALTLPPGKHRVTVTGTTGDLPVTYEAEVNVQIKSQGDVTVKPGATP